MSLLDKKLLRDLRSLKSQALAVALVMACGLAMMVMTRSLILSLDSARTAYYEVYRFGEVFARLKRAPLEVARRASQMSAESVPSCLGTNTWTSRVGRTG